MTRKELMRRHSPQPLRRGTRDRGAFATWLIPAGCLLGIAGLGLTNAPNGPAPSSSGSPSTNAPTATTPASAPEGPAPVLPRDFYNAGTRKLKDGKLRESEAFFETALASQNERVQPVALYNLGHVRFGQGVEQLKKGPPGKTTMAAGASAGQSATGAIQEANKALAGDDMQSLIAAYMRGRGARKELKAASEAVRRAVEAFGAALSKWQRASGDFKGAVELNPADDDAKQNADIVDRNIAKLVDSLREMESMANAMGNQKQELGEKLKELKGRIPAPNMPPGAAGDDDEEEDKPNGPKEGDKEGPTKEGQEMSLSPEQAGWLLDGFKLGGDHRLPMGQGDPGDPRKRNRPTW